MEKKIGCNELIYRVYGCEMGDVGVQGRVLNLSSLTHYTCSMFWISLIDVSILLCFRCQRRFLAKSLLPTV